MAPLAPVLTATLKPISKLEKDNNKSGFFKFFKKAGIFKLLEDPIYSKNMISLNQTTFHPFFKVKSK